MRPTESANLKVDRLTSVASIVQAVQHHCLIVSITSETSQSILRVTVIVCPRVYCLVAGPADNASYILTTRFIANHFDLTAVIFNPQTLSFSSLRKIDSMVLHSMVLG